MLTQEQVKNNQRLIEVLRTGAYRQGKLKLRDNVVNRFCCLGVACDLVQPDGWDKVDRSGYQEHLGHYCSPGPKVMQMYGWNQGVLYAEDPIIGKVMEMNDSQGKTFPEIADAFEEWLNAQEVEQTNG